MNTRSEHNPRFLTSAVGVCLLAGLCSLLWGSAIPFINLGYRHFSIISGDTASQILFAGCRFFLAGLLTILITSAGKKRFAHPVNEGWACAFKLSLVQTIAQYFAFYIGVANTASMKASIIQGLGPFVSILIACYLFRSERMTPTKWLAGFVGILGVLIVNMVGSGFEMKMTVRGEGALMVSMICGACSAGMIKQYSRIDDPVTLNGWQFMFGGALMAVSGLVFGGRLTPDGSAAFGILGYLSMLSAIAYSLWSVLLRYNPISRITVFSLLQPIFGSFLALIFFGQEMKISPLRCAAALTLVCISILLVNRGDRKKA